MEYTREERMTLWLTSVEGIGLKRYAMLMDIFGSAEAVWENIDSPELALLGKPAAKKLRDARDEGYIDGLLERMEKSGTRALIRGSADYPELLDAIADPPPVLYARGSCPLNEERVFSIVGSRRATRDGKRAAREIASALAREGVTVVSGMARGIDTAAHEGTLEAGGRTIAVFGCGADVIYPPENAELAARVLDQGGAILSEYPPGTQPNAGLFPARNRIISGLTPGTLIVEGAKGSGAMITIRDAEEQNRDVFAVPGSIYSSLSDMPNRLIVDGAKPVLSAWEILEYYRWAERPDSSAAPEKPSVTLTDEEKRIVEPLTEQPLGFEELVQITQISASRLNSHLTMLELRGIIEKAPGGMYRAYIK